MDGESEGLRHQVARLELTIQAEMEKGKVLQVTFLLSKYWIYQTPIESLLSVWHLRHCWH